jgi:hypothetical protein
MCPREQLSSPEWGSDREKINSNSTVCEYLRRLPLTALFLAIPVLT